MRNFQLQICAITLLTVFLLAGCDTDNNKSNTSGIDDSSGLLVVAGLQTMAIVDLQSMELLPQLFGLGNAANCFVSDGDTLFVVNSMSNDLSIFSFADSSVVYQGSLDLGLEENRNPFYAILDHQHNLLISNLMQNTISRFNPQIDELLDLYAAGVSPAGLARDENHFYSICSGYENFQFAAGSIIKYDLQSGQKIDSIACGINSQFAAIDNFNRLHVVCTGDYSTISGEVRIYHTETLELITTIPLTGFPGRLALSDWGIAYVAGGGWQSDGVENGLLLRYDLETLSPLEPVVTGLGAIDVCINEDKVFVACFDEYSIDVIQDDTLLTRIMLEESPQTIHTWKLK
jgi:hypothetical protein